MLITRAIKNNLRTPVQIISRKFPSLTPHSLQQSCQFSMFDVNELGCVGACDLNRTRVQWFLNNGALYNSNIMNVLYKYRHCGFLEGNFKPLRKSGRVADT